MNKLPKLWLSALPVLLILIVTLTPANGPPEPVAFCIACGRRGLADGILNAILFFPLGFVPVGGQRPFATRVLAGFLLSVFVELIQAFVPGRDPSLSDVVFNTLGTILGVYAARMGRRWVDPDKKDRRILTSVAVAAVIIIAAGTILSLSPLHFSEWRTHHFETAIARADTSDNLEVLALIPVTPEGDTLAIKRWGNSLGLVYPTWAGAHGLDEPVYWSYDILHNHKRPPRLSLDITKRSWRIELDSSGRRSLGASIGLGWALLLYPDAVDLRWIFLLQAIWLFALCFPIGYWSSRRYFVGACGAVVGAFFVLPLAMGATPMRLEDWAAVASGLFVGQAIGAVRVPRRSNH